MLTVATAHSRPSRKQAQYASRRPARQPNLRRKFEEQVARVRAKFHLLVAPGRDYRANHLDPDFPMG